jgi:hypothetical protein
MGGKGGKSRYSPAAAMDWRAINAARPEERQRITRKTRILLPLTEEVIRKHLTGKQCWVTMLSIPFFYRGKVCEGTASKI